MGKNKKNEKIKKSGLDNKKITTRKTRSQK